jgi:hypothetical protein
MSTSQCGLAYEAKHFISSLRLGNETMSSRCIVRSLATVGWLMICPAAVEPLIPRSELPGLGQGGIRQRVDVTAAPW